MLIEGFRCPICGGPTLVRENKSAEIVYSCRNDECDTVLFQDYIYEAKEYSDCLYICATKKIEDVVWELLRDARLTPSQWETVEKERENPEIIREISQKTKAEEQQTQEGLLSIASLKESAIDAALFKRSEDIDRILSAAEKRPEIQNVLAEYSLNLDGGGLSVYRGQVDGRNTNTIDQITDIYWRIKACGAGEGIACAVINNAKHLSKYLEMKASGISDVLIANNLMDIFYK